VVDNYCIHLAAVSEGGGLHLLKRQSMKLISSFLLAVVCAISCEAAEPDRTIIPLPEPAFEGKIGKTYKPPFAFTGTIEEVRIELK
jgi:hypothetical protein